MQFVKGQEADVFAQAIGRIHPLPVLTALDVSECLITRRMNMLEVKQSHIEKLNDSDLRELVHLLCIREVEEAGYSRVSVTSGGHQDAPDGGIDVRVRLEIGSDISGFVPRASTGFQVKTYDMQPAKIILEMKPKGSLRESIHTLSKENGAYVIVSVGRSHSDSALKERLGAMKKAAPNTKSSTLKVDYYDSKRVADWVNKYPAICIWVREKLGDHVSGWRNLVDDAQSVNPFLYDETKRVLDGTRPESGPIAVMDAIHRLRELLRTPGTAVRLVGQSGTGKTKLVSAIFDSRVGENYIDPSVSVYTDEQHDSLPQPIDMLSRLITENTNAVMIIDNCRPETHASLVQHLRSAGHRKISLLTVEYDVREDIPESTEVFRLDPLSPTTTESMLKVMFPSLRDADRFRIADFSGGNARVAVYLASTAKDGQPISKLSDRQLRERIIFQGRGADRELLVVAQICSLAYSFDGETENNEWGMLAALSGIHPDSFYSHMAELTASDILQRRSRWRALLPQALAIPLAADALDSLRPARLDEFLLNSPPRLVRSFTRRLGFLHDSPSAQRIADRWLAPGGMLWDLTESMPQQIEILSNIAPIRPEKILQRIQAAADSERGTEFLSGAFHSDWEIRQLLLSLAYDPIMFDQAAWLLARAVAAKLSSTGKTENDRQIEGLFQHVLSGTHATVQQRIAFAERARLQGGDIAKVVVPAAIKQLINLGAHSGGSGWHEFGSLRRDFGYEPKNYGDLTAWLSPSLKFVGAIASDNGEYAMLARERIALWFHRLWELTWLRDQLTGLLCDIRQNSAWIGGWVAVAETLHHPQRYYDAEAIGRLVDLELTLRPNGVLEKVRAYVIEGAFDAHSVEWRQHTTDGHEAASFLDSNSIILELGRLLSASQLELEELLPELIGDVETSWNYNRREILGQGLANGSTTNNTSWDTMVNAYQHANPQKRNTQLLWGYLEQTFQLETERGFGLLDSLENIEEFQLLLPRFHSLAPADAITVERLVRLAANVDMPASSFDYLAYGGQSRRFANGDLIRLLSAIASKESGRFTAVHILAAKFAEPSELPNEDCEVVEFARLLLSTLVLDTSDDWFDMHIGRVAEVGLRSTGFENLAKEIGTKMQLTFSNDQYAFKFDFPRLAAAVLRNYPRCVLETLVQQSSVERLSQMDWTLDAETDSIFDRVEILEMVEWANEDSVNRYPRLAAVVSPFGHRHYDQNVQAFEWSARAKGIIDNAPDPALVLDVLYSGRGGIHWSSGSIADQQRKRIPLCYALLRHKSPSVAIWAAAKRDELLYNIARHEIVERQYDQGFE